jgi:hypothetical protein
MQLEKPRSSEGWVLALTRADIQALAVLLQPLDPLLQLPLQCVIQQELLALEGV